MQPADATGTVAVQAPLGTRALRRLLEHVRTPLHRDGYALVLNSTFTAATGLLYWILAANVYTAHAVGVNSVLISSMMFLAGLASLNLPNVVVRFLPEAGRRTGKVVAWSYAATGIVAAAAAAIFLLGVQAWAPRLSFLGDDPLAEAWFVLATVGWCLFTIQDGVLTALGRAVWVPLENAFFALAKLGLLAAAASLLPLYGIFVSWTAAMLIAVVGVNGLIFVRLIGRRRSSEAPAGAPLGAGFARYFVADYVGSLAWLASINLLPVIITAAAGATTNGYFALAWAVAFPLYAISANVGTSLVLHGAARGAELAALVRKAGLQVACVLVPAVVALILLAPVALTLFGGEYADHGTTLLRLLVLGSLPNAVLALAVSAARVQRRMGRAVAALGAQCALSLGLVTPMLHAFGVTGAGVAWLASQCIVAAVLLGAAGVAGARTRRTATTPQAAPQPAVLPADLRGHLGEGMSGAWLRRWRVVPLARRIVAALPPPQRAALANRTMVLRTLRTDSDVVVVRAEAGGEPRLVVKVAWSPAGAAALRAHCEALGAIRRVPALDGLAGVLPEVVTEGSLRGRQHLVERALPGVDGRRFARSPLCESALSAAADRIGALHRCTATPGAFDDAAMGRIVDQRLATIARARPAADTQARLAALRRALEPALSGLRVGFARVHGDLWLGNLLLSADATSVTGIVDWEASRPLDLPGVDLAHLVLATRSARHRRELGVVARSLLEGTERLTDFERGLIESAVEPYAEARLPLRELVLLAWLQHVAQRLDQGTLHHRARWLRRNVAPVLATFGP